VSFCTPLLFLLFFVNPPLFFALDGSYIFQEFGYHRPFLSRWARTTKPNSPPSKSPALTTVLNGARDRSLFLPRPLVSFSCSRVSSHPPPATVPHWASILRMPLFVRRLVPLFCLLISASIDVTRRNAVYFFSTAFPTLLACAY